MILSLICFSDTALSDVGLSKGDSVVVSTENKPLIALGMGYVHTITDTHVHILLDR